MSYIKVSQRKTVLALDGIFDPCQDTVSMLDGWVPSFDGAVGPTWARVSAPGGDPGFAHRLIDTLPITEKGAFAHLSPYRGETHSIQQAYPIASPLKWKYRCEARVYIVDDDHPAAADQSLGACFSVCLDGAFFSYGAGGFVGPNFKRILVNFCVAGDKAGIMVANGTFTDYEDFFETAWAADYNTFYDIRVTWEYDFFTSPTDITITAFVDDVQLFSQTIGVEQWRGKADSASSQYNHIQHRHPHGKIGIGIMGRYGTGTIDVYFKDILFTLDEPRLIKWEFVNSLLQKGAAIFMTGLIKTSNIQALAKGTDVQLWARRVKTDDFEGAWRGVIRDAKKTVRKIVKFSADGYEVDLLKERWPLTTLTAKTTGEIVIEAINNPTKTYFDTETYFDATSTTYTRTYNELPKIDSISEAAALEGFIIYNDIYNKIHYQSIRSNYSEIHIKWGEDRIINYSYQDVVLRKPNLIRINGYGVYAEKIIIEESHAVGSKIVREINRLDLTTQAEVNAALDYYTRLFIPPIKVLEIELSANFSLQKGKIITLTLDPLNISQARYLINMVGCTSGRIMKLQLFEESPQLPLLIAQLGERTETQESQDFATDTQATDLPFNTAGHAILGVRAQYEIEFSSVVERSGEMIITDDFIDDILDLLDAVAINDPTHIGHGTGTASAQYDDTALGTQTARPVATATRIGTVVDYNQHRAGDPVFYYQCKFEITVVNPAGVTELGLFNAGAGGTMSCRQNFASYTKTGSVTFRIILSFIPEPGSCYVSFYGIDKFVDWVYDGTWTNFIRLTHHRGNYPFVPSPFATNHSFLDTGFDDVTVVPNNIATWTFVSTPFKDLDEILFRMSYPDYLLTDAEGVPATSDSLFFALRDSTAAATHATELAIISTHRQAIPTSLTNYVCEWDIVLKIQRGFAEGYGAF